MKEKLIWDNRRVRKVRTANETKTVLFFSERKRGAFVEFSFVGSGNIEKHTTRTTRRRRNEAREEREMA